MNSRSLVAGRGGMLLIAWLLLAHLATGSSMLHALSAHHASASAASQVTVPAPTGPVVVACPDGGACSVADRAIWQLPVVPPGVVLSVVLVVLAVLTSMVHPRHGNGRGPSPPLHLSAQVVLVI